MRHALTVALGMLLLGCPLPATSGVGGGGVVETVEAGAGEGTYCGTDPTTGVSLCLGLNLCPTLNIDGNVFPNCGFRISGTVIDLECLCGQFLCPLGPAASCSDAATLLAQRNAGWACAGQDQNRCAYYPAVTSTTSTTSSTTTSSSGCDKTCRDECAGVPTCIQMCGC